MCSQVQQMLLLDSCILSVKAFFIITMLSSEIMQLDCLSVSGKIERAIA